MTDRNLSDLCTELQGLVPVFISQCANAGIIVKPTITWRSAEDQDAAKASGLSNASAGQSPHNHTDEAGNPDSLAFDFAVYGSDGSYITDGTDHRYVQAGAIAKGLGLEWGGDWHHPDFDHVELANWKTYDA